MTLVRPEPPRAVPDHVPGHDHRPHPRNGRAVAEKDLVLDGEAVLADLAHANHNIDVSIGVTDVPNVVDALVRDDEPRPLLFEVLQEHCPGLGEEVVAGGVPERPRVQVLRVSHICPA